MRNNKRTRYTTKKEWAQDLEPFDPARTDYTDRELELYADVMLRGTQEQFKAQPTDSTYPVDGELKVEHPIVFQEHIESRWRKEVHPGIGTPDAAISNNTSADGQRMFNRQHPQGRKVNSNQQRKVNGASYYR